MTTIEERLAQLGITIFEAPKPLGSYVPCVQTGNLLFVSGMLPLRDGILIRTGRVGHTVTLEEAQEDARQCVINALSAIRSHLGSLDKVKRCVRLNGYIASAEGFTAQPKVLNAASELLFEIFGGRGIHTRTAIGVYILSLNSSIEPKKIR